MEFGALRESRLRDARQYRGILRLSETTSSRFDRACRRGHYPGDKCHQYAGGSAVTGRGRTAPDQCPSRPDRADYGDRKEADEPSTISSTEPPPAVAGSKTIALDSGKIQLAVTVGLREAEINGVKHWLAFPVVYHDGQVLVSRLDLSKIIEPNLRPELIPGMQSVTTVVLDPGHGGHDRGAASRFGYEKDFALDVALRARPLLEKQGYKVVMTRATDVFIPLDQRSTVANHIANSIFVSIHFNSSNSNADARGFEIFSMAPRGAPATNDAGPRERDLREEPGNAVDLPSGALACSVFHALLGHVPMVDRGVKHARFAVLRFCTQPAVLVECGFVSNNAESTLISSSAWRAHVAEAIADGVENYKDLAESKTRPKVIADYRRAISQGVNVRETATP